MNESAKKFDRMDIRILAEIQSDGRLSVADLAERVHLSASSCWRRIKQMEDLGIIRDRVTVLDEDSLGLHFMAFAVVKLAVPSTQNLVDFEREVMAWPEVLDCYTVTGAVDFMLRIVTTDIQAYDRFLRDKLLAAGLVADAQSRIVVTKVKHAWQLPLELVVAE